MIRRILISPLVLSTFVIGLFLLPNAVSAHEYELRVTRDDRATTQADGSVQIRPFPVGIGGIPAPMLRVSIDEGIEHIPANILELKVKTDRAVDLIPLLALADGAQEVMPTKRVEGLKDEQTVRWMLDDRSGNPAPVTAFNLTAVCEDEDLPDVSISSFGVVDAADLSIEELLQSTSYRALNLKYHQLPITAKSQEVVIVLPLEIIQRYEGGSYVVEVDKVEGLDVPIEESETMRKVFAQREDVFIYEVSPGEHLMELYLKSSEGDMLKIDEQKFLIGALGGIAQFEAPYQSIESYVTYKTGPDLRVVTVFPDLYTRDESELAATNTHEMFAYTVSLESGDFEGQAVMRTPAFAHWAAGGFHSLGIVNIPNTDTYGFFMTGSNSEGFEAIGIAATTGNSPIQPHVVNPMYTPYLPWMKWEPGMKHAVRGNALSTYGRSYLLLNIVQAGENEPKVMAALSPDLRTFADAGELPIDTSGLGAHLSLMYRGGMYYLLSDNPNEIWVSDDPLRGWERRVVQFPEDWSQFRLSGFDEQDFLYGVVSVMDRKVLRVKSIEWTEDDIPLPKISE